MDKPLVINAVATIVFSLDYVGGDEINQDMGERYFSFILYDGDTEKEHIYAVPESTLDNNAYKFELMNEGVYLTDFTIANINEALRGRKPGVPYCEYVFSWEGYLWPGLDERVMKKLGKIGHEREQYFTRKLLQAFIDRAENEKSESETE